MQVYTHHHIGKRSAQEDFLGYSNATYIICDGVGGHKKGDKASQFIVNQLLEACSKNPWQNIDQFKQRLIAAQEQLNALLVNNPEWEKMGTTLVALLEIKDRWYTVHIGDSRLILARPKAQKIWHTWDHSFVMHLVKMGEISREDARLHPRANEIQKAIMANTQQEVAEPEIHELTNIKKGDLILMCTDGITEVFSDYELAKILTNKHITTKIKSETIFSQASNKAKDNNTAIIIEFESNSAKSKTQLDNWFTLKQLENDFSLAKQEPIQKQDSEKARGKKSLITWLSKIINR